MASSTRTSMKKIAAGFLAAAALAAVSKQADAQLAPTTPFSIEVRGGAAIPTGDFKSNADGDWELKSGWTAGVNAQFQLNPMFGVYAGYSHSSFGVEDEDDASVNARGFDAGVRASLPLAALPLTPFVRGGVVYHDLQLSVESPNFSITSDRAFGFEIGGGLEYALGQRMSITPGVSFTSYTATFSDDLELFDLDIDVTHVKVDIGLRIRI